MDTNERKPIEVETEERKREQDEARPIPEIWMPAAGPEAKRAETPEPPVEKAGEAAPAAPVQYSSELAFTCILVPRFSDHYLVGDIINCLSDWMKQICISYGWRLEAISIRPGYLQWVMQVPLNANPAHFMRLIRRFTSEKIFEDFPRFKNKNVSGEFWAPGNFVVPGNQLQTPEQIDQFILQTRRYQGLAQ